MSYSTDPNARASFIGDLRALADFLDRPPGHPRPAIRRVLVFARRQHRRRRT